MLQPFVPSFSCHVFEGYNAKIPDETNAYMSIDAYLKKYGFEKKQMPTSLPNERRFIYWKDSRRVIVTVYYAGSDIRIEMPSIRTEAVVTQDVLNDFIEDYVFSYVKDK